MGKCYRTSLGSCSSPSLPPPGSPCPLSSLSASGLIGAASVLGECCLWRGLLAPFYSWGSRCPKSLGLSRLALGGHLQSRPALLPTAEQESARPDSPHHRQALGLPAILGNGTRKDDEGDGPEGKISHEVENREITQPRSQSTSGHSKDENQFLASHLQVSSTAPSEGQGRTTRALDFSGCAPSLWARSLWG